MERVIGLVCVVGVAGCLVSFDEALLVDSSRPTDLQSTDVDGDLAPREDTFDPRDLFVGDGKAPLGSICTQNEQCESSICVGSVCCDSTCTQHCYGCDDQGHCMPVLAGKDPLGHCTKAATSTCGLDGYCDGKGACRLYPSGTICQRTCAADTSEQKACDGKGACVTATAVACSPYACNATTGSCYTSCSADTQCAASFSCKGQFCK